MSSAAPRTRPGLIALLVARRVKGERERRRLMAEAKAHHSKDAAEAARELAQATRRSGWLRR
ncbi:MAG: hypothetical protein EON87_16755 [Brevundimonas sp.]|nr:MAG: hypothetical protein EON87_16755 [Brevundimonas sp.]